MSIWRFSAAASPSKRRPSHQPTTPHAAATAAPIIMMPAAVMPAAPIALCACAMTASAPRYTGTSIVFLALYFVSLSSGLQSISRPGRTNAYSPKRRSDHHDREDGEGAGRRKREEARDHDDRNYREQGGDAETRGDAPSQKDLRNHGQALDDPVEPREHARAVCRLGERDLDEAQLLEIQQRAHRGDADDEECDAEQIRRAQHSVTPAKTLPPRGRSSTAAAPGRSFQIVSKKRWHTMAATNSAAPRNRMPLSPMAPTLRSEINGPANAPALPPAAMTPNSRFVCALLEQLEQEAPEHRDQQQVDDADEDVKGLTDQWVELGPCIAMPTNTSTTATQA